jgi:O-succinylbenzoic acid--CoA ligase
MNGMWQNHISGIHYNGEWLSQQDILDYDVEGLAEWEKEIFLFMKTWVNDAHFIEVYTSGSTGPPKQIQLAKESMFTSARFTCSFLNLAPGDTALLCLPTRYIGGKMMIVRSFAYNLKLWAMEPKAAISFDKVFNFVAMTPHQLESSLQLNQDLDLYIEKLILGGSATPKHLKERISKWHNRVFSTYGMTETSSHIALQPLNGREEHAAYVTIDPSIRLSSDDSNRLILEAPYLGNKAIYTNDIVAIIGPRRFEILGRMDNVINSGGIKLHPEKIEQKLEQFLDGKFFIYGVPDQQFGERPVLIYEKKGSLSVGRIREICKLVLSKMEQPEQIIETKALVLTRNGKIKRKESYLLAMAN